MANFSGPWWSAEKFQLPQNSISWKMNVDECREVATATGCHQLAE